MIRFGKVIRMITNILAEVKGLGGTTQNRVISIKGLYSKVKNEDALIIPLSQGNSQDVVFVLQKEKDLKDGDVYVTDDKSFIHFHFNGNKIEVKTKELLIKAENYTVKAKNFKLDVKKVIVNAKDVKFDGCTITNDGTSIDKTHTHTQNSGNHFGGGATTSPPD